MATSVPVPMASPRSAWASAAASLTPSPTMATTRPSACSWRTTVDLVGRQDLGDHVGGSMPTSAATASAVRRLSPVSRIGPQTERTKPADGLDAGGLHGVGDHEERLHLAVPGGGDRRSTLSLGGHTSGLERWGQRHGEVGQQRRAAHDQRMPIHHALHTEALAVGEGLDRGQRPRLAAGHLRRWPSRSDARRRPPSAPTSVRASSASTPSAGTTATNAIWPVVTVPVLSSTIGVDAPGRLEDLGALDEDAELGAPAGTDQQRGGCRQAERARAGDDQHRHRGGERQRGIHVARARTRALPPRSG